MNDNKESDTNRKVPGKKRVFSSSWAERDISTAMCGHQCLSGATTIAKPHIQCLKS